MQSLALLLALAASPAPAVQREEFRVTTHDGVGIAVRQVRSEQRVPGVEPIVLLHGARVPGIPSFDLPVPGGSLAADLALRTGAPVFVPDARGYGRSDRPPAMERPPEESQPLSRAYLVLRDVDAVVRAVQQRTRAKRITLLGWATGGLWAGFYASLQPERVGHLVLLNSLYGGSDRHPMLGPGSPTADPAHPDRLDPSLGGYGHADAAALLRPWDRSIPESARPRWRDPAVAQAYVEAALASDPASSRLSPPALRAPTGALEDSFFQASGRRLYDAGSITAAVLLVRGGRDFWSRPEDLQAFQHDAVHAASVEVLAPPEAIHFLHLDRPEHGREALLSALQRFLAPAATPRRATSP
jgi:pimeloyl-ACP methyl ester carboxylesterase